MSHFLLAVILWHFAAVSYSLYKIIDEESRHRRRTEGLITVEHLQNTLEELELPPEITVTSTPISMKPTSSSASSTQPPPSYEELFSVEKI